MRGFVTDCVNVPKPLDFGAKAVYSTCMKNETTLPVYDSLEALLAAEVPQAAATEKASDFPSWGAAMGEWALASETAETTSA